MEGQQAFGVSAAPVVTAAVEERIVSETHGHQEVHRLAGGPRRRRQEGYVNFSSEITDSSLA
jgi:hypothetical protein